MNKATLSPTTIAIDTLGFDAGAHLLVKHALAELAPEQSLRVTSRVPGWQSQLAAWAKAQGHPLQWESGQQAAVLQRGSAEAGRWQHAAHTGHADPKQTGAVLEQAQPGWGLAARGARVEAGGPQWHFKLDRKQDFWTDSAADLYAQAVSAQWSPDTALDWGIALTHPPAIEAAIVQVMTYMIENENAALLVPARFLGQLHPHYRELQAALAIQIADEARHIEVFTRRVRLGGSEPALSTAGGQTSLKSLLDEPDFSIASFLLSVLGEGTFVNLLQYLQAYAPDPLTRSMCRLAARDEARHVALGMSHLLYRLQSEPELRSRLAQAVEARHDQLAGSAGLNEEVFDALIVIGAGALTPEAIHTGFERVQQLIRDMGDGRFTRLLRLGFERDEAERLSALHTRNFM